MHFTEETFAKIVKTRKFLPLKFMRKGLTKLIIHYIIALMLTYTAAYVCIFESYLSQYTALRTVLSYVIGVRNFHIIVHQAVVEIVAQTAANQNPFLVHLNHHRLEMLPKVCSS